MNEIGAILKATREAKGLSLEEVRMVTKIRTQQLKMLEEGEFDRLPGEVYVKGFLVNYAKALDLDGEEILQKYYERKNKALAEEASAEEQLRSTVHHSPSTARPESPAMLEWVKGKQRKILLLVVGMAALCLFIVGTVRFFTTQTREPVSPETETTAVAQPPEETIIGETAATAEDQVLVEEESVAAPQVTVSLLRAEAVEVVWLGVYEKATGRMLYEGTLYPQDAREWLLSGDVTLRIGNAGGLRLSYKGQDFGALGYSGQVITKEITLAE